jgi:hypothetical protein
MKRLFTLTAVLLALIGIAYGQALQPFSFPFVGRWNPSESPLLLDDYGLQDIQNVRKAGKHFKGVSGHTKINTTSLSSYPYLLNGFHFRKDQPAESHVIVYAADSHNPTGGRLYQNTTAIPGTGDFSATVLHTPTSFNDVWRFSNAPAGNMVATNGDSTLIWGGNEIEATMIVSSSSTVTYTLNNPNEYTDILNNTRTTSDQVATFQVNGGNDANTMLLVHGDGADAATSAPDASANGYASTAVNQAQLDTAAYKFGTSALLFDGAGDAFRYGNISNFKFLHNTTALWTVDCWYKSNSFAVAQAIFDTTGGDSANVGAGAWIGTDRKVTVQIVNASAGSYIVNFTTTGTVPNDTNWHHIAITYDQSVASSNCKVYVDGVQLAGAGNKTAGVPSSANHTYVLNIGQLANGSTYPFNGWLDEVRVSNVVRWTGNFSVPTQAYGNPSNYILVGSKRPLQGVKFYVYTSNASTSTMTVKEWQGNSGWTALTVTDGTASGGIALAQTGSVTWTATGAAKTRYINGLSLYWYQFYFDAGSAGVYYVTTDAPMSPISNIWDGTEGYAIKVLKYDGSTFQDYTDDVGDDSTDTYAEVSSINTTHYLLIGFLNPQQAINLKMVPDKDNSTASVLSLYYWNGADWTYASAQNDGTAEGGKSLGKGGVVSWQPPDRGSEWKRAIADEFPLYYYKLQWSVQLDATTQIAEITGVESPDSLGTYKFSDTFQNRLFLCNEKNGNKNRCIYSVANAPDLFNGTDSGELLFGDKTEITSAAVVYNVFMNTAVEQMLVTKKSETYRVSGDAPDTWLNHRMSANIGNVAPLSMVSCEVTDTTAEVKRTVAIWVSDKGPVMSDGATIIPIYEDVKCYWDPNDARYIPAGMQSKSVGWYDPSTQSYKLLVASGANSTYLNTELEYSLKYKEWTKIYRENGSGANPLQSGFQAHDTSGLTYTYGGGKDGYLYRLENGNNWAGTSITSYLHTKDMILDNEKPMFRKSTVKYMRSLYKKKAVGDITISHYGDGTLTTSASTGQYGPVIMSNASTTTYNSQSLNLGPWLYHSFKYSATTNIADGLELNGFGVYFAPQDAFR